jgi:flagellar basal body rod protein FlgG
MNVSLYQAASAMNTNAKWQEVIMENLAQSNMPGYKRLEIAVGSFAGGTMDTPNGANYSMPKTRTATDFAQGEINPTGVPTNLALDGQGFFEVQANGGTLGYTRDGQFHINTEGKLVTKNDMPVMGETGPVQSDPKNHAPITISPSGEITQGKDRIGKLKVVQFNDPQLLTRVGGGFYLNESGKAQPRTPDKVSIQQGCLENANTSPVAEMAKLIIAMRTTESGQKSVQLADERMSKAINDLGNPT